MTDQQPKKAVIDPGRISAWISLTTTAAGLLSSLATSSSSLYNPVDTAFVFLVQIAIIMYFVAAAVATVGGAVLSALEDNISEPVQIIILVALLIIAAAIFFPIGIDHASEETRYGTNFIGGITGIRIAALGLITFAGWLAYRFLYARHPESA